MESETTDHDLRSSGSFKPISSACSSLRRHSLSLSGATSTHINDEIESGIVSQAGDIGDRALHSSRRSVYSSNLGFSFNHAEENGVVPVAHDALSQSSEKGSCDRNVFNTFFPISPLPTDPILPSADKTQDDNHSLPPPFEYISCLVHLAVFGILGVITRYLLQKLFGSGVAGVTSDLSILYLDLPSNMVGSFLMGWLGVVFKGDILIVSDNLAIGLTTGYLGSLTTFSGWNQKMLELSVKGQWLSSVLGYVIGKVSHSDSRYSYRREWFHLVVKQRVHNLLNTFGVRWATSFCFSTGLFLAAYSIIFGIETAKGFRWLLKRQNTSLRKNTTNYGSFMQGWVVMVIMMLILGFLWGLSVALEKREFMNGGGGAQLWLACIVGPVGVWLRWLLARLNGRGLGRSGSFNWVPVGTLVANVMAACLMAALSTIKKVVNTKTSDTVATGIQLGFLGCLSTVSTFIAEFNAMRLSNHPWRAYAYATVTIIVSFILGTLIFSVPVWTKGYN